LIKIEEDLKDLHRLHLITKDFNHIIEYEKGSWKLFEPSKFVYSYFAFNTFYNFDWNNTIKKSTLSNFPKNRVIRDGKEEEQEPSERFKFKALIDFIFEETLTKEDNNAFFIIIKGRGARPNPLVNNKLMNCINEIIPDRIISPSDIKDFKNEFKKIIDREVLQKGKLKNEIIGFIYQVRNNIFHGTKTTIEMTDKKQRQRLEIYSNILIATNELLFRVLSRKLKFSFDNKYRINFDES
jgi:hypothetical protein